MTEAQELADTIAKIVEVADQLGMTCLVRDLEGVMVKIELDEASKLLAHGLRPPTRKCFSYRPSKPLHETARVFTH